MADKHLVASLAGRMLELIKHGQGDVAYDTPTALEALAQVAARTADGGEDRVDPATRRQHAQVLGLSIAAMVNAYWTEKNQSDPAAGGRVH